MGTLALIATAFGLGLLFNAAPGPVFAATVQAGVRGGFKPALAVQLGSIVGDGVSAVLGLAGVGVLLQFEALRLAIGAGGVAYLLRLAWQSWRASREEFVVADEATSLETRRAWRSGVMLSLTNPQNLAYWTASFGPSCSRRSSIACSSAPLCGMRASRISRVRLRS
jgi:chemosensory pili system protein ChpE